MTGYPLQGEENQKDRDLVAMATGADHLVLCWLLAYGSLLSFPVRRLGCLCRCRGSTRGPQVPARTLWSCCLCPNLALQPPIALW